MCVLRAFNERYEALCNLHICVCMCLKVTVKYGQQIRVFVFFDKTEWVNVVLRILNLEGQQSCIIGSKVTTILPIFFSKNPESSNIEMWGDYPEAIDCNIALRTQIFFWAACI